MIWDKLFLQYKTKPGLYFGSKFMNFWGRLLIGNPKDNGLGNLHPELQRGYYYLRIDRFAPPNSKDMPGYSLDQYRRENLRLTQYREAERKRIAKASAIAAMLVCVGLIMSAGLIRKVAYGVQKASSEVSQVLKGDDKAATKEAPQIEVTVEQCQALGIEDATKGTNSNPEAMAVCREKYLGEMNEALRQHMYGSN